MWSDEEPPVPERNRTLPTAARRLLSPLRQAAALDRDEARCVLAWSVLALAVGALLATSVGAALGTAAPPENGADGLDTEVQRTTAPVDGSVATGITHGTSVADASLGLLGGGSVDWMWTTVEGLPGESVVLLGAYSRYDGGSALDHPARAKVDEVVTRLPGLHVAEIARRVDSPESTVRYHARVLERETHVRTASVRNTVRLYPAGTPSEDFELYAALRDDSRSRVLRAIARREPASVTTLAEDVDRAASTVSHHLGTLEEAGLIERERTGQSVQVSLGSRVRERLSVPDADDADADAVAVDPSTLELHGD